MGNHRRMKKKALKALPNPSQLSVTDDANSKLEFIMFVENMIMSVAFMAIVFDMSVGLKVGLLVSVFVVIYCSKNWNEVGTCQEREDSWDKHRFYDLKSFASLFHVCIYDLNIGFSVIKLVEWFLICLVFYVSLVLNWFISKFFDHNANVLPMTAEMKGDNESMYDDIASSLVGNFEFNCEQSTCSN